MREYNLYEIIDIAIDWAGWRVVSTRLTLEEAKELVNDLNEEDGDRARYHLIPDEKNFLSKNRERILNEIAELYSDEFDE